MRCLLSRPAAGLLAWALAAGCSPTDPRVNLANLESIQKRVAADEDIRLADVENLLGPGKPLDPKTSKLPLPVENAGLTWKAWGNPEGGDYIVVSVTPEGRINHVKGAARR